MNTLKSTYRLAAVLTLILFVSSIALPTVLSAANFNCDKEVSHIIPVCCATADMDNHQEKKNDTWDCEQQAFCEQAIDSSPSDIPALIQSSKIVLAAELLEELTTVQKQSDHPPAFKDEAASLHHYPPIFLLNSTFLN